MIVGSLVTSLGILLLAFGSKWHNPVMMGFGWVFLVAPSAIVLLILIMPTGSSGRRPPHDF